jgi:hypothetical protein
LTPSRLNDAHRRLVIDASVLINLLGTRVPGPIFSALGRIFAIDEVTLAEVNIDPATQGSARRAIEELQAHGLLTILNDSTYEQFLSFTGAEAPNDLDDGEAATLAHACSNAFVAVIDERKATRVALSCEPPLTVLNSLDLLAAHELTARLGSTAVADALFFAIRDAKMRVPREGREWTVTILGNRAQECPALARFVRNPI